MSTGYRDGELPCLDGRQKRALRQALLSAYPSWKALEVMLSDELDIPLAHIASSDDPLVQVVHEIIKDAGARGWTRRLITSAAAGNPGNPQLRELIDSGYVDRGLLAAKALDDPSGALRELLPQASVLDVEGGLERVISAAAGLHNVVPFATRLLEIATQVCSIGVVGPGSSSSGTGFLVGPDVVLTNHHVVRAVLDGVTAPTGVRCVFDYHVAASGEVVHGTGIGLAADWKVADSPPSPADETPTDVPLPTTDELDYALIRIAEPIGAERGWMSLLVEPPPLTTDMPLLIVQHPAGNPVKLAVERDGITLNGNGTRLRYGVNTRPGSSGSPCLSFGMEVVALHHAWSQPFARNQGIPIALIADDLRARGVAGLLA